MLLEHLFVRNEVLPSWFPNALQHFLSVAASQFALVPASPTSVSVVAGADVAAAAIAIGGAWRWNEATVTRSHPGGAAGDYDVFATAAADNITSSPAAYTDATNRAFALAIKAAGSTPTIVPGTVDAYRKVGSLRWDGAQILWVTPTVGPQALNPALGLTLATHVGQPVDGFSGTEYDAYPTVRREGDCVRLAGGLMNTGGSSIAGGVNLGRIPSGLRHPYPALHFTVAVSNTAGLLATTTLEVDGEGAGGQVRVARTLAPFDYVELGNVPTYQA